MCCHMTAALQVHLLTPCTYECAVTPHIDMALPAHCARSKYIVWHMEHMIKDYPTCVKTALKSSGVAALRECLQANKRALTHADILWFDEHFLATLRGLLPDVRSMFGFGSGRGDFERDFYNAVRLPPSFPAAALRCGRGGLLAQQLCPRAAHFSKKLACSAMSWKIYWQSESNGHSMSCIA